MKKRFGFCWKMPQNWVLSGSQRPIFTLKATIHYTIFRVTVGAHQSKTPVQSTQNFIGSRQRLLQTVARRVVYCIGALIAIFCKCRASWTISMITNLVFMTLAPTFLPNATIQTSIHSESANGVVHGRVAMVTQRCHGYAS